ncbi:hypothetical protein ScPMuIL_014548 [Solemya velum]
MLPKSHSLKYAQQTAKKCGLVGWTQNTKRGTVIGQAQGKGTDIGTMKNWLKKVGSPKSRIERCVFKNERRIDKLNHKDFIIIK